MNLVKRNIPSHEYIVLKHKDEIIIDHKINRYYTIISGVVKVKKINIENNCLDIMLIKFSDTIKLKSNNYHCYSFQALTSSKILGR
uniref:Global nitrogen transcriptional regulator n=1 Tax=Porphyridium sordidum TaxID=28024 RepID=A0A1C9CDN9_PORSO|nr:hypothetical protein Psor_010 [Porphyridium sordidum]AOM66485.1 hypothetical protein Psor_010 [Porphyridium sordidum]